MEQNLQEKIEQAREEKFVNEANSHYSKSLEPSNMFGSIRKLVVSGFPEGSVSNPLVVYYPFPRDRVIVPNDTNQLNDKSCKTITAIDTSSLACNLSINITTDKDFYLDNENLYLKREGTTPLRINSANTKITNLIFEQFKPETVRIQLTSAYKTLATKPEFQFSYSLTSTTSTR